MIATTATLAATQMQAQTASIVMEDTMVRALDTGISIFVRNKRSASLTTFRPERTVLYVHGATYPASTSFDLALDGFSWMDYLAARSRARSLSSMLHGSAVSLTAKSSMARCRLDSRAER